MQISQNQRGQLEVKLRRLTIVCDMQPDGVLVSDLADLCEEAIDAMTDTEVEEFLSGALVTPAVYVDGRLFRQNGMMP
ncbi:hypothetical protein HOY34_09595 [Xinfangfangia sp. D13-10-4-6]|uniref:hypothetical protein n=1 Tax=Pseudogemmobacter hezensis TaxID=2737662 RepID=UPI001551B71F|nr:hypothetical protein [Pseudogemmobacter hezensis]NPD15452.1 hypothetical protein [Pseudogemmobacter hezensis]